jgi:cellulose synthase (UDP-forming)
MSVSGSQEAEVAPRMVGRSPVPLARTPAPGPPDLDRPPGTGRLVVPDLDSPYLPTAPTDEEKYSYLRDRPQRWIFYWLLIGQLGIVYGFIMVMIKASWTAPALMLLIVVIPPILVNFWLRTLTPRLNPTIHRTYLASYQPDPVDTVDIWLPTCGEPLRVLRNQYRHVALIRWHAPVAVWVLDDADRPEVAELVREFGYRYVVRPDRGRLKKAGNLTHAFGISTSRFGVVFDADFVPRHDFLVETIPYMADPKVGVVQTAQYFDVYRDFNYIQRFAGSLQEIFFRWIQPARDVHKAAIVAGTNLVYRRSAVEAAGGFAQVPIGEDVHSGVKLWWAGYETRYVPLVLAKGIAPNSFRALANQQYRWCRSSMLLMVERHFRTAPLSFRQRLAFWAAFFYYMASAALLITGPLPTLIMLWFFPQMVRDYNYLPMVPAMLATFFVFPAMTRGWRPSIYRVCTINSACHLLAVFHALRDHVEDWVPTGTSRSTDRGARSAKGRRGRPSANTTPNGSTPNPDTTANGSTPASSTTPDGTSPGTYTSPKRRSTRDVPTKVDIILRSWIVTVVLLLWTALAVRIPQGGLTPFWATLALATVQLYFLAPLLTKRKGLRERVRPASKPAAGPATTDDSHDMTVMMERFR